MADTYLEFSTTIDELTAEEEKWLLNLLKPNLDIMGEEEIDSFCEELQLEDFDEWPGFQWEIIKDHDTELHLYSEGSGDIDQVARLSQKFLTKFRPFEALAFSYSVTCSKARIGEFGGGAFFITADALDCMDVWSWCDEKWKKFQKAGISSV